MYEKLLDIPLESTSNLTESLGLMLHADGRPAIVLSDFDYTLCNDYYYDHATNNHLPQIEDAVISAAHGLHLIVATGRRANHPHLPRMWSSGLVEAHTPVIAENGGTLVFPEENGLDYLDLVDETQILTLKRDTYRALDCLDSLPDQQQLVIKDGRTCIIARLEDDQGIVHFDHQLWLEDQLKARMELDQVAITNSRVSVSIHGAHTDKGSGFGTYLELLGIERESVCVIGMGDAENDTEIFTTSDITVGFSDLVRSQVQLIAPNGSRDAALVLQTIKAAI